MGSESPPNTPGVTLSTRESEWASWQSGVQTETWKPLWNFSLPIEGERKKPAEEDAKNAWCAKGRRELVQKAGTPASS